MRLTPAPPGAGLGANSRAPAPALTPRQQPRAWGPLRSPIQPGRHGKPGATGPSVAVSSQGGPGASSKAEASAQGSSEQQQKQQSKESKDASSTSASSSTTTTPGSSASTQTEPPPPITSNNSGFQLSTPGVLVFALIFLGGAIMATMTLSFTAEMELSTAVATVLRRIARSSPFRQLVVITCAVLLLRYGLNNFLMLLSKFSSSPVQWDKTKLYYILREVYQPLELLLFIAALCTLSDAFIPALVSVPKQTVSHIVKSVLSFSFIMGFTSVVFNLKSRFCKENAWQAEMKGDVTTQRRWEAYDKLGTFVIYVMSFVLGIQAMGLEVTSVLAIGGIGGLAIGLAGREICENLLNGFLIMSTNPFEVGDEVTFFHNNKTVEGFVIDIGWYRTLIRSFEREVYVIPNAVFSKNIVLNISRKNREWRFYEALSIRVQDVQKANSIVQDIRRIVRNDTRVINKLHRRVFLDKITQDDARIYLSFYLEAANRDAFMAIKQDLLVSFVECVEKHGAKLAVPRTVVDMDPEVADMINTISPLVQGASAFAVAQSMAQAQGLATQRALPGPPTITVEAAAGGFATPVPPSSPGGSKGSSGSPGPSSPGVVVTAQPVAAPPQPAAPAPAAAAPAPAAPAATPAPAAPQASPAVPAAPAVAAPPKAGSPQPGAPPAPAAPVAVPAAAAPAATAPAVAAAPAAVPAAAPAAVPAAGPPAAPAAAAPQPVAPTAAAAPQPAAVPAAPPAPAAAAPQPAATAPAAPPTKPAATAGAPTATAPPQAAVAPPAPAAAVPPAPAQSAQAAAPAAPAAAAAQTIAATAATAAQGVSNNVVPAAGSIVPPPAPAPAPAKTSVAVGATTVAAGNGSAAGSQASSSSVSSSPAIAQAGQGGGQAAITAAAVGVTTATPATPVTSSSAEGQARLNTKGDAGGGSAAVVVDASPIAPGSARPGGQLPPGARSNPVVIASFEDITASYDP